MIGAWAGGAGGIGGTGSGTGDIADGGAVGVAGGGVDDIAGGGTGGGTDGVGGDFVVKAPAELQALLVLEPMALTFQ